MPSNRQNPITSAITATGNRHMHTTILQTVLIAGLPK